MKSIAARTFCWTSAVSDPMKYASCALPHVLTTPAITIANSARVTTSSVRVRPRESQRSDLRAFDMMPSRLARPDRGEGRLVDWVRHRPGELHDDGDGGRRAGRRCGLDGHAPAEPGKRAHGTEVAR